MSQLVAIKSVSKSFGPDPLFDDISMLIYEGERLGLIGANGSGKSTLLKIIAGIEHPDEGTLAVKKLTRVVYLSQWENLDPEKTVEETLMGMLTPEELADTERYSHMQRVMGQALFPDTAMKAGELSGGWAKRLAVTCSLVKAPELLLMDEPTNHLDLEGIVWLEGILKNAPFATVIVSHDRYFLENTTNRTVELGRCFPGGYLNADGAYNRYVDHRETFLEAQLKEETVLANKMRRETEWLSRGPKARTTKAQYRIDEAGRLREKLGDVKKRNRETGRVDIDFDSTNRKTKKLLEAKNLEKSIAGTKLFEKISLKLSPGSCLGLLGGNGTGKSTFMSLIAQEVVPDRGYVEWAEGLKVASFEQDRGKLDQSLTLKRALVPDGDSVVFRGRSIHAVTWAKRFLFTPDQLEQPVSRLSGGEQARILIANLMRQPADLLLLDEPTNDLDIPSLEILEDSLLEFPGAVVIVTHDRFLLDKVAKGVLGFDGKGGVEIFADCHQWIDSMKPVKEKKKTEKARPVVKEKKKLKFSYKDQFELDNIEEKILEAEGAVEEYQNRLSEEDVMGDPKLMDEVCRLLQPAQELVDNLYARWEELETLKNG